MVRWFNKVVIMWRFDWFIVLFGKWWNSFDVRSGGEWFIIE